MPDSVLRRAVRVTALTLFLLALTWTALLLFAGGFDTELLGTRISTNEPLRPLLIACLVLTIFILAGGDLRPVDRWLAAVRRVNPGFVAIGMSVIIAIVGVGFATTAASGADAYGYVSQADLWLRGDLRIEQAFAEEAPWPSAQWTFSPLGYRPTELPGDKVIVPTYSPGLPLLMAAAKLVGGQPALYLIVPIAGGVLVLATFGLGRRLASPAVGLVGAWLVATSPVFLFMLMWPMTDIPVAAAWATSFYFLLGSSRRSMVIAGLAATIAILIRPNLAFLAGVMCVWVIVSRRSAEGIKAALAFAITVAPGTIAAAAINNFLYGSPFQSGYVGLSGMFQPEHVLPNIKLYLGWFAESQTLLPLVGLVALFVPLRRLWPAAPDRRVFGAIVVFIALLWAYYMAYLVFDTWWYLRFLLSSWPFIMLGVGAVVMAIVARRHPLASGVAISAVILLGFINLRTATERGAFLLWQGERRYVSIGQHVARLTEPNSVIFSSQHSGSLRYYGGRMSLRFDNLDPEWLDRAIDWFESHGLQIYLLVEDWEEPVFRERFAGSARLAQLGIPPVFKYEGPAKVTLYDLTRAHPRDAKVEHITETYAGLRDVPPVPAPTLVLKSR